ncbi:MAG TPA: cell division protein FtsK, partial [Micromonospora sp.]|nr:cell division protein FtsK [Micromonospora sp.]
AAALATDLALRQEVETIDAAGLTKALDQDRPGYLVVFGMDAVGAGGLPADQLRSLLREGPGRGVHLLSWWRGLRRFNEAIGGSAAREDVAGLVFLNVPAADVSLLLGESVAWQPRPNRALLHDRHAGRTAVIVPFVRPEREL